MKKAFMVMPFFDETAKQAYELCIKPIFKEKDIKIRKADEIFTTNPVYDDIVREIQDAQVIVVDISGKNPNVFYELGISHQLKQNQTIILTHDEYKEMPFDIAHFRIIHYDNSIKGSDELKRQLKQTLDYIFTDYVKVYKDEYEIVMTALNYTDKYMNLIALVGLSHTGGIVKNNKPLIIEGHIISQKTLGCIHYNAYDVFDVFVKLDYVKDEGDSTYLTDKGKGFAQFLFSKGYVCDFFDDITITKGFIPNYKLSIKKKIITGE